jgi:hypothetical protein
MPLQTNMFLQKRLEYNNEQCFLRDPSRDVITKTNLEVNQLWGSLWTEDLVGAVEESPPLETITRERLVKAQQTEKT